MSDLAVLEAFAHVPRHRFVPEALRHRAYEDAALPIGGGQTISQPSTQARYLEALALQGTERVLEVGTGSGYQTALLARLASYVVSIERVDALAQAARRVLSELGVRNVTVLTGDGSLGWRALAPYDAIVVAASSPVIPQPLIEQLAPGGRLVLPLEQDRRQILTRVTKTDGEGLVTATLGDARFVPLIGRHGHSPAGEP